MSINIQFSDAAREGDLNKIKRMITLPGIDIHDANDSAIDLK